MAEWLVNNKDLAEALSYWATALGIVAAVSVKKSCFIKGIVMSKIRKIEVLWISVLCAFFLLNPTVGFTQTSAYERSNAIVKQQIKIIQGELSNNYTCDRQPNMEDFRAAESRLFTELNFLKVNETRHFVSHPDFSGILSYCDLIQENEAEIKELNELGKTIQDKKRQREIAEQTQKKMAKELNEPYRDKIIKGIIEIISKLQPATSMEEFTRKVLEGTANAIGHQETFYVPKGKFAEKNMDRINQNVENYFKNELRQEYKKNYPDSIGAQIERKLKNREALSYNENSYIRMINDRMRLEIEKLARQEYHDLTAEIPVLEKKLEEMRMVLLPKKKGCVMYKSLCDRIRKFQLWVERTPAPRIVLRLTASHAEVQKGDPVTFTYSVTNSGNVALSGVQISANIPAPIDIVAKDRDSDAILDPGETWTFQSTVNIQSSTVNRAEVNGKDDVTQRTVAATATTTVAVIVPSTPMVAVPDLMGSPREAAEEYINRAHLTLHLPVRAEESTQHKGLVCRQEPEPHKLVPRGSLVRIWIAQERKPGVRTLFIDPPTRTIRVNDMLKLRAYIWYEDGTEVEVTEKAVWTGAPGGVVKPTQRGSFTIQARYGDYTGSSTVHVRDATWSVYDGQPPLSKADQVDAKALPPPPDAYTWFALCDKKTGEVTYGEDPVRSTHFFMAGPFYGPVPAEWWINQNCPTWRCDKKGKCATAPVDPPTGVNGWYVLCEKRTGDVTLGKEPDPQRHHVMAGPHYGEPLARQWVNANCPNWRCSRDGTCAATTAKGGEWKVLCGKKDLQITLGTSFDLTRSLLIEKDFRGEQEARAWVNQHYPTWSCTKDGQPVAGPRRGGPWGIYCDIMLGQIVAATKVRAELRKLEDNFFYLDDAQQWMNQHYPSGLCDGSGRYMESAFSEVGSQVGQAQSLSNGKGDFAEIGSSSTKRVIQESQKATLLSHGGTKGFSMHNMDDALRQSDPGQAAREKQAMDFFNEFMERNTRDITEYQNKITQNRQRSWEIRNAPPTDTSATPGMSPDTGKNYVNDLKCRNGRSYLANAIKAKDLKAAQNILEELRPAGCDYYADALAQVKNLESLLEREKKCDWWENAILEDLKSGGIGSIRNAELNLRYLNGCSQYERVRAQVETMSYTQVPNLVGMHYRAAHEKLKTVRLYGSDKLGSLRPTWKHPDVLKVERQSIAPGTRVKNGTTVTFWWVYSKEAVGTGF